jgi:hypothetical protein
VARIALLDYLMPLKQEYDFPKHGLNDIFIVLDGNGRGSSAGLKRKPDFGYFG